MAHDRILLDRLEAIPVVSWTGNVFRYTAGDRSPGKENIDGARWSPRDVPTVYAGLSRDGAIAEFRHHLMLLSPRPTRIDFTLYEMRVSLREIIDLRPLGGALGLTEDALTDNDFSFCQAIGHAAWWLGRGGLIVPSARLAGATNLVIFTDKQPAEWFEIADQGPLR